MLTSHPTFLIIRNLTYNLAMTVNNAAMVTVKVAARIVGPSFSSGRTGGLSRCDNAFIVKATTVYSTTRDLPLGGSAGSWYIVDVSAVRPTPCRAYEVGVEPLLGYGHATGCVSRCGVHDKSSQT